MSFSLNQPNVGKHPLVFTSGDWAKQANGSVVVSCGETYVLVTACMSKKLSSSGYFPLMVEYQEKTYAAGRIPGGAFHNDKTAAGKERFREGHTGKSDSRAVFQVKQVFALYFQEEEGRDGDES